MSTISSTAVVSSSPGPTNIAAPPTLNGIGRDQDTSWDLRLAQEAGEENGGVTRDQQPYARKERLKWPELLKQNEKQAAAFVTALQEFVSIMANFIERSVAKQERFLTERSDAVNADNVAEQYECVAACLQGYNDFLFDLERPSKWPGDRRMHPQEREKLKREGLGYITQLLEPRHVLNTQTEELRKRVLRMLPPRDLRLCNVLHGIWKQARIVRNHQQHLVPDRATVLQRLRPKLNPDDLETLEMFLADNPQRLPSKTDPPNANLCIFAPDGTYRSVELKEEELRLERANKEANQEAAADLRRLAHLPSLSRQY